MCAVLMQWRLCGGSAGGSGGNGGASIQHAGLPERPSATYAPCTRWEGKDRRSAGCRGRKSQPSRLPAAASGPERCSEATQSTLPVETDRARKAWRFPGARDVPGWPGRAPWQSLACEMGS